jgi:hypothetical protein
MNANLIWVLMLGLSCNVLAKPAKPLALKLSINLRDGSKLIGETDLESLGVRSESLGRLDLTLGKIRSIKLSADRETALIGFENGDTLKGNLLLTEIPLRAIFGQVRVPLDQAQDIRVDVLVGDVGLQEGLMAYYPFVQDAEDRSGNENHGKVVGARFENGALRFGGDGSTRVEVPRSDSLEPNKGLTISMWLKGKPGQEAGGGWGTILRKAAGCQAGYGFRGGGVSSFILEGREPCRGTGKHISFRAFDEQHWQHIVGTFSFQEGIARTYQDGELVNQLPITEPLTHTGDLYIGGATVAGDDGGFRGLISEVRIYNRGLSEREIRALQQLGTPAR